MYTPVHRSEMFGFRRRFFVVSVPRDHVLPLGTPSEAGVRSCPGLPLWSPSRATSRVVECSDTASHIHIDSRDVAIAGGTTQADLRRADCEPCCRASHAVVIWRSSLP